MRPETLASGLIRTMDSLKVDRPATWSKSFEGLGPIDLHVLAIAEVKPDVILREIKDYLDVPNSTLTGIIDRLEGKGLIERVISERPSLYGLKRLARAEVREEQRRIRGALLHVQRRWTATPKGCLYRDDDYTGDRICREVR
jgi:DNA-binding MarR family transcriptional regulator